VIRVSLLYTDTDQQQEVLLAGIPRRGEFVRLTNGRASTLLEVEGVTWIEGSENPPEPSVLVSVRTHTRNPR
jgi:hypothetical protein